MNTGVALTTTDAGHTWKEGTLPGGIIDLLGVSCPTGADCWAVGAGNTASVVIASRDGGTTWTSQTIPAPAPGLIAISCPTISDCIAIGGSYPSQFHAERPTVIATTDGGTTWADQTLPPSTV